jgi:hypothetical protein
MSKFSKWAFGLITFFLGLVSITSIPGYATLIATQTVTNQTAVTFTGITSLYDNYLIVGNSVTNPSFAGNFFGIQISTDGGSTYIDTDYSSQFAPLSLIGVFNPTSTSSASFEILISNVTSGDGNIQACGTAVVCDPSVPGCYAFSAGGGYLVPTTVADAIQLVADDGSTFSGTFSLYGYTP